MYDALLLVSFGGPEGPDEVMPFLENVLRGRNVPRERMLDVAGHYQRFGGVSPINEQNRRLISALERELATHGPDLPIYFGNRNWHPLLTDTVRKMSEQGVTKALAIVTSAFSSYSGCRQYREDIQQARADNGSGAPVIDKIRVFFNHPGFVEAMSDRVRDALGSISVAGRDSAAIVFTAHSIPMAMSQSCLYTAQFEEACRLVGTRIGRSDWRLAYQSRSDAPNQPWLEPDVGDLIRQLHHDDGISNVVVVPIGFISDHMEVLFDLDTELKVASDELGVNLVRARTVGTHPRFISGLRELVVERMSADPIRQALGCFGPSHDTCPSDCCPSGRPFDWPKQRSCQIN